MSLRAMNMRNGCLDKVMGNRFSRQASMQGTREVQLPVNELQS